MKVLGSLLLLYSAVLLGEAGGMGGSDCPILETEWCDGLDNDCDDVVDNGNVCPDETNSMPTPYLDNSLS